MYRSGAEFARRDQGGAAMPLDEQAVLDRLRYVEAPLNYLVPMVGKPVSYNYPPPPGVPERTGEYKPVTVRVHDARPLIGELSLDKQGVAFTQNTSAVQDFYDRAQV